MWHFYCGAVLPRAGSHARLTPITCPSQAVDMVTVEDEFAGIGAAAVPETTCDFYPNNPNNPSKVAIIRPPKTAESRG